MKEYYVKERAKNGGFGNITADVIALIPGTSGADRFYVMALQDIDGKQNGTYYCWYHAAYNNGISDYDRITSTAFGAGRTNTNNMIAKYNEEPPAYGERNTGSPYLDMWGVIQEEVNKGWFVPSKEEWSAFGYNFNITSSNYNTDYKLSNYCWSSSPRNSGLAWLAAFSGGFVGNSYFNSLYCVRLSTTF